MVFSGFLHQTDHHDIIEILLEVALNTKILTSSLVLQHIVTTNQWLVFINDTGNLFIAINDKFLVVLTKLNNTNNILRILSCEDKELLNPVGKFESFEISKWW